MKKKTSLICKTIIAIVAILTMFQINNPIFADVGSFEDYSSGSDWGGSSSSDWSSSSSSDWGSSSGSGSRSGPASDFELFIGVFMLSIAGIILVLVYIGDKNKRKMLNMMAILSIVLAFGFLTIGLLLVWIDSIFPGIMKMIAFLSMIVIFLFIKRKKATNNHKYIKYDNNQVISKIMRNDPTFNKEEFEGYAKDVFIKLQNAWTERNWEKIRIFETQELFEQHKVQLDGYIKNNQINVMERINVNAINFVSFEETETKEFIKVDLDTRMADYIIDATTKNIIRGDRTKNYYHTYTLTFIRTKGNVTQKSEKTNGKNCPNCGAPINITSAGRCEYCNSVITTEDHGWVLSNLTRRQ